MTTDDDPASSKTDGADAGLCPRIAFSLSYNLHVCLPLPITPLWSFLFYFFVHVVSF